MNGMVRRTWQLDNSIIKVTMTAKDSEGQQRETDSKDRDNEDNGSPNRCNGATGPIVVIVVYCTTYIV
jgi:hypothetical protein